MILKELDPFYGTDPFEIAGHRAEKQMAFYLKREFGDMKNVYVINGLRLERGDDACQIDHLLVHPWGTVIIESKSVTTEVRINERDEWSRLREARWTGMASPIKQAKLQFRLLHAVLDDNAAQLLGKLAGIQRRFGGLQHDAYAAISDDGIVVRPDPTSHPNVLKADSICEHIRAQLRYYDKYTGVIGSARAMLTKSVFNSKEAEYVWMKKSEAEATAKYLVSQHRPLDRREPAAAPKDPAPRSTMLILPGAAAPVPLAYPPRAHFTATACADCSKPLTDGVASYCRREAPRFSNRLYCMTCQQKY